MPKIPRICKKRIPLYPETVTHDALFFATFVFGKMGTWAPYLTLPLEKDIYIRGLRAFQPCPSLCPNAAHGLGFLGTFLISMLDAVDFSAVDTR